jgi:hypothetical protein
MYDFLRLLTLIKYSLAISSVSWLKITDISGTISVPIVTALIGTKIEPEKSVIFNQLTRLVAREYFINVLNIINYDNSDSIKILITNIKDNTPVLNYVILPSHEVIISPGTLIFISKCGDTANFRDLNQPHICNQRHIHGMKLGIQY